jgi:fucose permease
MLNSKFLLLPLAYAAFVSLGLPDTVLGVAWPSLQTAFGLGPSAMGAALAASMCGYLVSGLGAGEVIAQLGVGRVLTLSSVLVVGALCGYALAPSWQAFFPFGAVWGLGSGAIDAGLNGYAARHFSARHVNWLHGCWGIGASIGPAVMTFCVSSAYGYRAGYALLATVLGCMTLLFLLTRRRWDEAMEPASVSSAPPVKRESLWVALQSPRVGLQMALFLLYAGVETSVGQWCFSWLRNQRGLTIEAAGGWTSAYWASLTVGRLVLGGLVDRVGPDRLLRWATLGAVIGVALFTTTTGLFGCLGLLLLGSSLAPVFPTLMARTPARVGEAVAHHAVGLQVSAATLGSAALPSVIGFLVARGGIGVFGVVVIGTAIALLCVHELLLAATRSTSVMAAPP